MRSELYLTTFSITTLKRENLMNKPNQARKEKI